VHLAQLFGTKPPASELSGCGKTKTMARKRSEHLVVCIDSDGYPAALEKRKTYVVLGDQQAEKRGLIRIIDGSFEDYLYCKRFFRSIALPQAVKKAVVASA
jgi:hypothetical protein